LATIQTRHLKNVVATIWPSHSQKAGDTTTILYSHLTRTELKPISNMIHIVATI